MAEKYISELSIKAAVPQNFSMTQVPSQQQEPCNEEAQHTLTGRTKKIFTDATTQTLSSSVKTIQQEGIQEWSTCPILEALVSITFKPSSLSPESRFMKETPNNVQLTSLDLASKTELQGSTVLHASKLSRTGEQYLASATKAAAVQREEASKVPVEAMPTCMARKNEPQASNGTYASLSQLCLVRKR